MELLPLCFNKMYANQVSISHSANEVKTAVDYCRPVLPPMDHFINYTSYIQMELNIFFNWGKIVQTFHNFKGL